MRSLKTKKPSNSDKTGNEGIQRVPAKTVRGPGLILLFDGEVSSARAWSYDEHSRTGILTSNLNPHSRLPGPRPVAPGSL